MNLSSFAYFGVFFLTVLSFKWVLVFSYSHVAVLSECSEECDARDFGARRCLFKENVPRRSLFFLLASDASSTGPTQLNIIQNSSFFFDAIRQFLSLSSFHSLGLRDPLWNNLCEKIAIRQSLVDLLSPDLRLLPFYSFLFDLIDCGHSFIRTDSNLMKQEYREPSIYFLGIYIEIRRLGGQARKNQGQKNLLNQEKA